MSLTPAERQACRVIARAFVAACGAPAAVIADHEARHVYSPTSALAAAGGPAPDDLGASDVVATGRGRSRNAVQR